MEWNFEEEEKSSNLASLTERYGSSTSWTDITHCIGCDWWMKTRWLLLGGSGWVHPPRLSHQQRNCFKSALSPSSLVVILSHHRVLFIIISRPFSEGLLDTVRYPSRPIPFVAPRCYIHPYMVYLWALKGFQKEYWDTRLKKSLVRQLGFHLGLGHS